MMLSDPRITRHQMYMEIAHTAAKRATCLRLNVGAVLVKDRDLVSIGYNGPPSGEVHCSGHACEGWTSGCKRSIHAERNAMLRSKGQTGMDLYVTHSPCPVCYDALWSGGRVKRIFFGTPFRETDHLVNPLFDCEIYRILPSGHLIEWSSGRIVDVEA